MRVHGLRRIQIFSAQLLILRKVPIVFKNFKVTLMFGINGVDFKQMKQRLGQF